MWETAVMFSIFQHPILHLVDNNLHIPLLHRSNDIKELLIYIVVEMWECGKRQLCFPYFHILYLKQLNLHNLLFVVFPQYTVRKSGSSVNNLKNVHLSTGKATSYASFRFFGKGYSITPNKYV